MKEFENARISIMLGNRAHFTMQTKQIVAFSKTCLGHMMHDTSASTASQCFP